MTKILARDPARRCKPLHEWPPRDRRLWEAALVPGDLIDPGGARADFAAASNRGIVAGYGRWLQWLDHRGVLDPAAPPASRVTQARIAAYVADLLEVNGSWAVLSRLEALFQVARLMDPGSDWSWLRRRAATVRAHQIPARAKRPRLVASQDLYELGLRRMAEAEVGGSARQRAIDYRDGLIVALLAARPLRRRSLAALRIGETLVLQEGEWWLDIPAADTKTGSPILMPLPSSLSGPIGRYIDVHREILRARCGRWYANSGNAFWLSSDGSPMTQQALYDRVVSVTTTAFGRPVNPHLFRDCAATSIAIDDPEHVRIAAPLLGHRSLAVTERHYNQARSREAAHQWQEHVLALRRP